MICWIVGDGRKMKCKTCASQYCSILPPTPKKDETVTVDRKGKGKEIDGEPGPSTPSKKRKREFETEADFDLLDTLILKYNEAEGPTRAYLRHRLEKMCGELGVDISSIVD